MNAIVVTKPKEADQAERAAQAMHEMAEAYEVDSPAMYSAAGAELQSISKRLKDIEAQRVYLKEPFLEGGRRIDAFFRVPLDILKDADTLIRSRMVTFQRAEAEKAAQARREAEDVARKEREQQERIRREAEAEQQRIRDEQIAADRKARAEAEALRRAGDEQAAREAEIIAERQRADAQERQAAAAQVAEDAKDAIEFADIAPVALPTVAAPKAAGVSTRQNWKAEVLDLHQLVCAAAKRFEADGDTTLMAYLAPDTAALGRSAKALKAQARIPGVRVFNDESLAVRAA